MGDLSVCDQSGFPWTPGQLLINRIGDFEIQSIAIKLTASCSVVVVYS
jgi:hypothetical protein|tara:strand:- start:185 stop:328 length:144 start_codon:yes stop_codon:yes gene_type:complete